MNVYRLHKPNGNTSSDFFVLTNKNKSEEAFVTGKKEFFKKIFVSLWACVRARRFNASGDPEHSIPVQSGGYHIQVFIVVP